MPKIRPRQNSSDAKKLVHAQSSPRTPDDPEQPRVVMQVLGHHRVELDAAPAGKVRAGSPICAWLRMLGLLTTRPMIERAPRIIGNIAMKALKARPGA